MRTPGPLLVWFRERERFGDWSTWVEARRYPCAQANVTAAGWAEALASRHRVFPTRRQVYADDIIRCRLLIGKTYDEVIALLGQPPYEENSKTEHSLHWELGPERDSFFQIDSDHMIVEFGPAERVKRVDQYQG
jgi:hypothetical protein